MSREKTIYNELKKKIPRCITEEEVRLAFLNAIEKHIGVQFKAERERNDASHNQIILEFKNKGFFKGSIKSEKFKEAVYDRLYKYIIRRSKAENIDASDYTGIAIDGDHICFCHIEKGKIVHNHLMPLSEKSILKLIKSIDNDTRRALTTTNLIEDFGQISEIGKSLMGVLSEELTENYNEQKNNKIKMLFEEWKTLFGQVSNLSSSQIKSVLKTFHFATPEMGENTIPGILFVVHTYNAMIMKFLGAEIVSSFRLTQYLNFCEVLSTYDDDLLLDTIESDIEKSSLFDGVGIKGFVEEAIFSWYIDAARKNDTKNICEAIRNTLIQLSLYRLDNLSAAQSKDVLKGFYQALIPDVLRKSLGEFYTPDWLVNSTIKRSKTKDWLAQRVLDPTCGSGSFLLQIIALKKEQGKLKNWNSEQILDNLLDSVWGFDLNPLAVQAARVNFLIAISELIIDCGAKEIELPILLADSVYSPAENPKSNTGVVEYRIGSLHADLLITLPSKLALDRIRLDSVFNIMEKEILNETIFEKVLAILIKKKLINKTEAKEWVEILASTYNRVLDLHKKEWNGIWFRIIRNFFWSATAGKFDLIVGNPPWVRWSNLPEDYREKIKPTCEEYTIFSETPFHGGNELDISGMITYTVSDKWLKEDGLLCFVITQTHFQTPSSQGFRSFNINEEYSLQPLMIDDLKSLKPFADAANKTSVAYFKKIKSRDNSSFYPVEYNLWINKKGFKKNIKEDLSLDEVLKGIDINQKEANPVDSSTSPWAIMSKERFAKTKNIRGVSENVKGRKGVTADLNGIYMLEIIEVDEKRNLVKIETRPEAGKKDIGPKRSFWIEPDLLHPLLKGASDFSSCYFKPKRELYYLIPNHGITKKYLNAAIDQMDKCPKTYKYLEKFEELLLNRSTYKQRLKKWPFYSVYNVGDYTFSKYKVIWAEQSGKFSSAVATNKVVPLVGERPYVPDHKIYFVDCSNKQNAYYLCGLLNSDLVKEFIESHTISIQVSNIFKHLNLPAFDSTNKKHLKLSKTTENLHNTIDEAKRKGLFVELKKMSAEIIE